MYKTGSYRNRQRWYLLCKCEGVSMCVHECLFASVACGSAVFSSVCRGVPCCCLCCMCVCAHVCVCACVCVCVRLFEPKTLLFVRLCLTEHGGNVLLKDRQNARGARERYKQRQFVLL